MAHSKLNIFHTIACPAKSDILSSNFCLQGNGLLDKGTTWQIGCILLRHFYWASLKGSLSFS
ncbi:MAG: hypothetical protein ACRC47_04925, partial [Shewanella sp.]